MVSVIIPAYNSNKYLVSAVQSVLEQTYQNFEIIIIDDCSTDKTLKTAWSLAECDSRITVISNQCNLGVAHSRNIGIDISKGEMCAFLDADDIWVADKLDKQVIKLESELIDICYTSYSFIDENGNIIGNTYRVPETTTQKEMLKENVIGCSTAMFRKSAIGKVRMRGDFAHEDFVFWLELMIRGAKAGGIDKPLVRYRVTQQGRSFNKATAAKNRWKVYREFLGLSCPVAFRAFCAYAVNGLKKHKIGL